MRSGSLATSGARTKAEITVATNRPGKIRNARLARKCSGFGVCSKLCVTRKPLIAKNTNTPQSPRMDWLPVARISHSFFCVPSAIRNA